MKLNIGAGKDIKKDYINIDTHSKYGAEVFDLNNIMYGARLPYDNGSVDFIVCNHVLEDFSEAYIPIMREFHRVLRNGGKLFISVPYGLSLHNPRHVRFFDETSFEKFVTGDKDYIDDLPQFSNIARLDVKKGCNWLMKNRQSGVLPKKKEVSKFHYWLYHFVNYIWHDKQEIEVLLVK